MNEMSFIHLFPYDVNNWCTFQPPEKNCVLASHRTFFLFLNHSRVKWEILRNLCKPIMSTIFILFSTEQCKAVSLAVINWGSDLIPTPLRAFKFKFKFERSTLVSLFRRGQSANLAADQETSISLYRQLQKGPFHISAKSFQKPSSEIKDIEKITHFWYDAYIKIAQWHRGLMSGRVLDQTKSKQTEKINGEGGLAV